MHRTLEFRGWKGNGHCRRLDEHWSADNQPSFAERRRDVAGRVGANNSLE